MAFRPSQYEHVSHGTEDPQLSYTSQSEFSAEGQYASQLQPQPYDAGAYDHQSVSPLSRGGILEDHQLFSTQQRNDNSSGFHSQPASTQFTRNFDSSESKTAFFTSSHEQGKRVSWIDGLSDWWWWELGSVVLSCACFIAIVITLRVIQDKSLSSWHSVVSPNALISTLATISKASLMLAVAACISQLKWLYFESAPHRLHNIQVFDDASRGPLGALELLTHLNPREVFLHRSGGAGWTFWASILTILALALDPFAQQILSFPLRTVPDLAEPLAASISTSQVYDTRNPSGVTNSQGKNVDMAMQGAVQNGLYILNSPAEFSCTTANCTWPTFYTVGVCSSCTNVTNQVKSNCTQGGRGGGGGGCNYTLPAGHKLSSSWWSSSGGGHQTFLNATAKAGDTGFNINITDWLVNTGIVRFNPSGRNYTYPEAFECSLSWCAKRYSAVKVTKGEIDTPDIRSWPLKSPDQFWDAHGFSLNPFEVADDTDFDGPNRTFTVNANDHVRLADWLAGSFFTTSNQEAVARALYLQPDMSQTFANIATSMTNKIRQGANATNVYGTSFREETYIHVTWTWLILPGVVVLMGVVLLAASIVLSRGDKQGLWKNSTLASLYTQMRGWEHEGLRAGTWSEMGNQAKSMRGRLQRDGQGGLDFVRA
jgi:hypothetical protein